MPNVVKDKNLRKMEVTPDTGKDFRDTMVVSGMATPSTPSENATNSTTQYTTSGGNKRSPLGGKHSNS